MLAAFSSWVTPVFQHLCWVRRMAFDSSSGDNRNDLPLMEHQGLCHFHDFTCRGLGSFLILVCALNYTWFMQSETSAPYEGVSIEASQYRDLPFISSMNHQKVSSRMPSSVIGLKVCGYFVHPEADTRVLSCVTSLFHAAIPLESGRIIELVKQKRWLVIWLWSLDLCSRECMTVTSCLVVTFGRAGNCGEPFYV